MTEVGRCFWCASRAASPVWSNIHIEMLGCRAFARSRPRRADKVRLSGRAIADRLLSDPRRAARCVAQRDPRCVRTVEPTTPSRPCGRSSAPPARGATSLSLPVRRRDASRARSQARGRGKRASWAAGRRAPPSAPSRPETRGLGCTLIPASAVATGVRGRDRAVAGGFSRAASAAVTIARRSPS